jgi:hypothetical protein
VGLGLALAGAGLVALLREARKDAPPLDQIDAESRRQLERVLEGAAREDGGR